VDGKRVSRNAIPVFEETCSEAAPLVVSPDAPGQAASEAAVKPRAAGRGIVLYFDFTALSFEGRSRALSATRNYLAADTAAPDEIMILAYARGDFTTHQGFTPDRSVLTEALARLLKDRATVDLDLPDEMDQLSDVARRAHSPACVELAREYALAEQERARRSLDQLERVIEYLKGRKEKMNLVLMTDALRLEPGAQYMSLCDTTPFMQGINLGKPLDQLIDAAEASGISIYTVHAGGMVDETAATIRYPGSLSLIMQTAARVGLDSAFGMQSNLALQTGGRFLRYTNDIAAILGSARRDLVCHYLLGYAPTNVPDGLRHVIRVKVRRASDVRHRPFFIDRIP